MNKYTTDQLAILHKLTLYKYSPSVRYLITAEEYNKLPLFLKGYAYQLQCYVEGSLIPQVRIRAGEFIDGMLQARTEVGTLSLKA